MTDDDINAKAEAEHAHWVYSQEEAERRAELLAEVAQLRAQLNGALQAEAATRRERDEARAQRDEAQMTWDDEHAARVRAAALASVGLVKVHSLCVECGPNVKVDEDGLCAGCGATAWGSQLPAYFAPDSVALERALAATPEETP